MTDSFKVEFGGTQREYKFKTNQGQRLTNEVLNPTLLELGVTSADMGRVYDFGEGLDLPAGTPTAFFAPNIDAFRDTSASIATASMSGPTGACRTPRTRATSSASRSSTPATSCRSNFDTSCSTAGCSATSASAMPTPAWSRRASPPTSRPPGRGRWKRVTATPTTCRRSTWPIELTDKLLVRAGWAKVMARPLLGNLAPTITQAHDADRRAAGGTSTIGNPAAVAVPRGELRPEPRVVLHRRRPAVAGAVQEGRVQLPADDLDRRHHPVHPGSRGIRRPSSKPRRRSSRRGWSAAVPSDGPALSRIRQFQDAPGGEIKGYETQLTSRTSPSCRAG